MGIISAIVGPPRKATRDLAAWPVKQVGKILELGGDQMKKGIKKTGNGIVKIFSDGYDGSLAGIKKAREATKSRAGKIGRGTKERISSITSKSLQGIKNTSKYLSHKARDASGKLAKGAGNWAKKGGKRVQSKGKKHLQRDSSGKVKDYTPEFTPLHPIKTMTSIVKDADNAILRTLEAPGRFLKKGQDIDIKKIFNGGNKNSVIDISPKERRKRA